MSVVRAAPTISGSPATSSTGASSPTCVKPLAGVLHRERAVSLGERARGDGLDAAGRRAGEQAGVPREKGDRDVGQAAHVDVEDRLVARGISTSSARIIAKAERSMPTSLRPGVLGDGGELLDHVAPDGDDDDARLRARSRLPRRGRATGSRRPPRRWASGCGRAPGSGRPGRARGGLVDGREGRACGPRCAGWRCLRRRGARQVVPSKKSRRVEACSSSARSTSPSRMSPGRSIDNGATRHGHLAVDLDLRRGQVARLDL